MIVDDVTAWLDLVDGARCAQHPSEPATAICARCGGFECATCLDASSARCHRCALAELRDRAPRIARSIAWKLALVPALLVVSLGAVTLGRGFGPAVTEPSLLVWLVPLACGLRLVSGPSLLAAWVGCASSLALVAVQIAPDALSAESTRRLLDLVLIGAGPLAALWTTVKLTRCMRQLRWVSMTATAFAGE